MVKTAINTLLVRHVVFRMIWTCLLSVALVAAVAGCAREPFPRTPIQPVKTFSLGSAKAPQFKSRPTAEELYRATVGFYRSFQSVSATVKCHSLEVNQWTEVEGRAEDVITTTSDDFLEMRWSKPGKELFTATDFVLVTDGTSGIMYNRRDHTYHRVPVLRKDYCSPLVWTPMDPGFPPEVGKFAGFAEMKLKRDQRIGGTEVYVLELKAPAVRVGSIRSDAHTVTIYLGRNDLLPRRVICAGELSKSDAKLGIPTNTDTRDFVGFVVNSKLPANMFSTKVPKGAKPDDMQRKR